VTALLVLAGAVVGAPLRYLADRALQAAHGTAFPWGILVVNVAASFVLGLAVGAAAAPPVLAAVGTGFCGALSTWSTLALDVVRLARGDATTAAVLDLVVSVLAGLGAAGLGVAVAAG
jgi:CrcB protein